MPPKRIALIPVVICFVGAVYGDSAPTEQPVGHDGKGPAAPEPAEAARRPPTVPADLRLSEKVRKKLVGLLPKYHAEPVVTYNKLTNVLLWRQEKGGPAGRARAWVAEIRQKAKPLAMARLKRDLDRAVKSQDLRRVFIAAAAANEIVEGGTKDGQAAVAQLRRKLLSDRKALEPVWKVGQVKGVLLKGAYDKEEYPCSGPPYSLRFAVVPKKACRLVRVSGQAENVSPQPDPPYVPYSRSNPFKKLLPMHSLPAKAQAGNRPRRAAVNEHFFLAGAHGKWYPCLHVCKDCKALQGLIGPMPVNDDGRISEVISLGSYVPQGVSFGFDVIFSVPEGSGDLLLVILGSSPVKVPLSHAP